MLNAATNRVTPAELWDQSNLALSSANASCASLRHEKASAAAAVSEVMTGFNQMLATRLHPNFLFASEDIFRDCQLLLAWFSTVTIALRGYVPLDNTVIDNIALGLTWGLQGGNGFIVSYTSQVSLNSVSQTGLDVVESWFRAKNSAWALSDGGIDFINARLLTLKVVDHAPPLLALLYTIDAKAVAAMPAESVAAVCEAVHSLISVTLPACGVSLGSLRGALVAAQLVAPEGAPLLTEPDLAFPAASPSAAAAGAAAGAGSLTAADRLRGLTAPSAAQAAFAVTGCNWARRVAMVAATVSAYVL